VIYARLIALVLKLLTAIGLYGKGRMDANAKRDLRDAKAHAKTVKDVLDEEASHDDVGIIRERMRERADR